MGTGTRIRGTAAALLALWAASCSGDTSTLTPVTASSCMSCHNGSLEDDYGGPGIENPHPFGTDADQLACTDCHGGDPDGEDRDDSHVPPPPEIGDRSQWELDDFAYFNRLTLTGLDKLPDYTVGGRTYSALDYLQFVNPGDLRVVESGRSCGDCHEGHVDAVGNSLLATEGGMLSGGLYSIGADNAVPESQGLWEDTAADLAFRATTNEAWDAAMAELGDVHRLIEFPVFSVRGATGPEDLHQNDLYLSGTLGSYVEADGRVTSGSPLANLFHEQVAFTCGDCHLGSAGANDRAGDFRSSGCTACHMPYSLGGRSGSLDPNVDKLEPANPDQIREPELPHVRAHRIVSTHKELPNGVTLQGIDDYTCAGCHQGSNRTVMQYWGIRLDQNEDLRRGVQYPANPVSFVNTRNDERLFDPQVGNHTFNGRDGDQYILFEDYDGDGRDDTPADVHYEAGLGCIDCHGSYDLHGGSVDAAAPHPIKSRMEQAVAITCESCHGSIDAYAPTVPLDDGAGGTVEVAVDSAGNPLDHVRREVDGYWLTSRLTGERHYVPQTHDVTVDTGVTNPVTQQFVFSTKASYAMGRADGDPATGIGPHQQAGVTAGFAHADNVSCVACHAAWTNTCMGCHLEGEYRGNGGEFSNITGEEIVFRERNADFVYQSPVPFQLGIDSKGKVAPITSNTKVFFQYRDRQGVFSETFSFSDRNAQGKNPGVSEVGALGHNVMMPHSIRGKVTATDEGPRYCSACHLTDAGLTAFGTEYDTFRTALSTGDYGALDFDLLAQHFGQNPGNTLDSPLWVHGVAGLGSGLYLFDEEGCPVNPLDGDAERKGCDDGAPAASFDVANVALDLDRIVDESGLALGGNAHPRETPAGEPDLRDGAADPALAGPLGAALIQLLTDPVNGLVLDSWLDADGELRGGAGDFVPPPGP